MNDIRTQLPECPLEYEVPPIPGNHTALVIPINATDIDWQEKMLPWTLASLINNTDIVMKGVHLKITSDKGWVHERVQEALKRFDLPKHTCIITSGRPEIPFLRAKEYGYDSVCMFDIHYWAFRGQTLKGNPEIKLPLGHTLRHNYAWSVADYNIHPGNGIQLKQNWIPTKHLRLTDPDSPKSRGKLANYFMDAGERARWLHDANRAVYGEDYQEENKNVAAYFFNESEPNWHLDASILQYQATHLTSDMFDWILEWRHLGTEALIALWLLKTEQHAYNLRDSLMIEDSQHWNRMVENRARTTDRIPTTNDIPTYPRLCNMNLATANGFRHAMKQLMGSQLAMKV